MKIEVNDLSQVKKEMVVEVGAETVQEEITRVLRDYSRKVSVPGFRKGKVPLSVVRARFGREVDGDVRDRLLHRLYHEATESKGLRPLGEPRVDNVSEPGDGPFRFQTTFEVLPEFTPKSYRGVEVRRQPVTVTEADVDEEVEQLRQKSAKLVSEEGRESASGDHLVVDLKGDPEGGEPFTRERTLLEVGAPDHLPEFNEHLTGVRAGAELAFRVDYPKEYPAKELAGRTVRYEIVVHEVKRRVVPALDDEWARDVGDFEDLGELRKKVRDLMEETQERAAQQKLRQAVVDQVLLENPIPLPETLVAAEVRSRLEDLARNLVLQGVDPRQTDVDWKEIRDRQLEPARKAVHAQLILDAVAVKESIRVADEEVEARVRAEAIGLGEKPEKLRARLKERGGMQALRTQLVREKSLDYLTSIANIQS